MAVDWMTLSREVAVALAENRPVVALESTLIAHGLPRPANLETAREAEAAVRATGAIPATIAVWHGKPTVGLSDEQLAELADSPQCVQGEPSRPRRRDRAQATRGDDGLRDDGTCARGRDSRVRDRRDRRGASRAGTVRHLRRPDRTRAHPGAGGVRRREEHSAPAANAGDSRNARRARSRLPHG